MKKSETIQIEGMSCGHCVKAVRETLEEMEGVEVEAVEIGSARVRYDDGQVEREKIEEAVEEAGFAVV